MFSSGKAEPVGPIGILGSLRKREDEAATYAGYSLDVPVSDAIDLGTVFVGHFGPVSRQSVEEHFGKP